MRKRRSQYMLHILEQRKYDWDNHQQAELIPPPGGVEMQASQRDIDFPEEEEDAQQLPMVEPQPSTSAASDDQVIQAF